MGQSSGTAEYTSNSGVLRSTRIFREHSETSFSLQTRRGACLYFKGGYPNRHARSQFLATPKAMNSRTRSFLTRCCGSISTEPHLIQAQWEVKLSFTGFTYGPRTELSNCLDCGRFCSPRFGLAQEIELLYQLRPRSI